MSSRRILYAKPSIGELERRYVVDALENGWGDRCYEYIRRFEQGFAHYIGVPHTIATSSCTGALHIALKALGVGRDDEVIVPDATWIASVAPITYVGAAPVFVDVLTETWCIDPKKIEKAITPKTKAIIVVHLYGNLCEMDEIMEIAGRYGLPVIEDAAEALGSEYKGRRAGSIGQFGVFSFHGTKTMTTGEGGALVCRNEELFRRASIVHDHGRDPAVRKMFWCEEIGVKYKMSNLQAALGCAQLERMDELLGSKTRIFRQYSEAFASMQGISLNAEQSYARNSYWMPTIVADPDLEINRDAIIRMMNEEGIGVRPFFHPVSSFPMFGGNGEPVSRRLGSSGLNLPSYFEMTEEDVRYVAETLLNAFRK